MTEIFKDGFSYRLEGLGYGFDRGITTGSALNPNNVLGIPQYQATAEVRLDLELAYENLLLGVKPRLEGTWEQWDFGPRDGSSDTGAKIFVNEWIVRYRFPRQVFASYGRENLQWGPSYLVSPSNPFIQDNGKNNPYLEVPGLDYARLSWVASATWTAQGIANLGQGELDMLRPFKDVYAGKIDFTGNRRFGSLVVSQRVDGPAQLGGYFGQTVSDAILAHVEGAIDDDGNGKVLVGGSYTFTDGSTLVLEYYYNGLGCRKSQLASCASYIEDADPGQLLYRSNYGFAQYFRNEFIVRRLDLTLRGTADLDDGSGLLTGILNYNLNDHAALFAVTDLYTGNENREFGALLNYSIMAGLKLSY